MKKKKRRTTKRIEHVRIAVSKINETIKCWGIVDADQRLQWPIYETPEAAVGMLKRNVMPYDHRVVAIALYDTTCVRA